MISRQTSQRSPTCGRPRRAAARATDAYFDALSRSPLMTADEERDKAAAIAALRRDLWTVLLSFPPARRAILAAIETELADERNIVAQARRARRGRPARAGSLSRAAGALVESLTGTPDAGPIASALTADLDAAAVGRDPEHLPAELRDAPGFDVWATEATRVHARLSALRNEFVQANLRLVVKLAHRFRGRRLPLSDLIQEGSLGLMTAVDRFDHRKGFRFSTYAVWWIRHAMTRAAENVGRTVRVPTHAGQAYARIATARHRLEIQLGRKPTTSEIADAVDMTPAKVARTCRLAGARTVSLDAPAAGGETSPLHALLADPDQVSPRDRLDRRETQESVRAALATLDPLDHEILSRRFGLDERPVDTLREIGEDHSLSRERIRQLQNEALATMRRALDRPPIAD